MINIGFDNGNSILKIEVIGEITTEEVKKAAKETKELLQKANSNLYCISDYRKMELSSKISLELVKRFSKFLFNNGLTASARVWDIKVWEKIVQIKTQHQLQDKYLMRDFFDLPTAEMWVNSLS